jgi:hypothetical protein
MRKLAFAFFLGVWLCAAGTVDLLVVNRIKAEAFENSRVMESAFYLSDVYGPRLTGSPGYRAAAEWSKKRLQEWGLSNARFETLRFGRGWSCSRFAAHMKEPQYAPLIGFARPWSPGTKGPVSGQPLMAVMTSDADFTRFKGKLKGRIVLVDRPRDLALPAGPLARRYTDADLSANVSAPDPGRPFPVFARPGRRGPDLEGQRGFRNKLNQFLANEGVAVVLSIGDRGDGGTVRASAQGSRDPKDPLPPPSVALAPEHYNRIARLLEKKIPVTLEFDIQAQFHAETQNTFNVLADLPGTDKKDELVLLGAHLDSWTGGTGATDNASGCAVMMEAIRILKALNLTVRRTVTVALWAGEEQGFLGSRAYVKQHLGDRASMVLKPGHARISGYLNSDNGGGRIRGVHLQNNDMMRPVAEAWLAPFRDHGATTVTIRNTGGTDHIPFDGIGIPGFQFIQDPLDYFTRTHHTNMDVYDRLQPGDLMQSAAVVASFAYHAANRDELLPRKPLPKPESKKP